MAIIHIRVFKQQCEVSDNGSTLIQPWWGQRRTNRRPYQRRWRHSLGPNMTWFASSPWPPGGCKPTIWGTWIHDKITGKNGQDSWVWHLSEKWKEQQYNNEYFILYYTYKIVVWINKLSIYKLLNYYMWWDILWC